MVLRSGAPRWVALLAALTVLLLVAGCGGGAGEAPPPPPAHDPPSGFGAASGRLFGGPSSRVFGRTADDLPAVLQGTTVWTTDGGSLQHVDATGSAVAVPTPPGRYLGGRPFVGPDGVTLLAGSATVIPGAGTTPPGLAAELAAVDTAAPVAADAAPVVAWTASAPLAWNARPSTVRLRVAGVSGPYAVVSAATDDQRSTVGVDLVTRRVRWVADGVDAVTVLEGPRGPVAVGVATPPGRSTAYTASAVVGLDATTGTRRFTVAEGVRAPTVARAGPSLVAVSGRDARAPAASLGLVGADGSTVRSVDLGTSYAAPRCVWDEATVTVCSGGARAFAVDDGTGADLWTLPDPTANRVAPQVTTAWHGAVYGTTVNGPVVLDARTGADRDVAPGAAPVMVNGYLAIAPERAGVAGVGGGAAIHPAIR